VLSHWPHVATQVEQQVAELVAELVFATCFNGTVHTSNLLLNLCPRMLLEPFTLDTLLSNKFRHIFDTASFNQSEMEFLMTSMLLLGCRPIAAAENMTSLGIPFSGW